MGRITIEGYKCERCDHIWVPREEDLPIVCPKCKSPYWNKPRRDKVKQTRSAMQRKKVRR